MGSLREIKDRIASVQQTLKIASAMKLVASSKLRKAQAAVEAMRPYAQAISDILEVVSPEVGLRLHPGPGGPDSSQTASSVGFSSAHQTGSPSGFSVGDMAENQADAVHDDWDRPYASAPVALVCFSANNSLCGGFNARIIRKALDFVAGHPDVPVEIYACGRKGAAALRRAGLSLSWEDASLAAHPRFDAATELARTLSRRVSEGSLSRVFLLYHHFVTMVRQEVQLEAWLPLAGTLPLADDPMPPMENTGAYLMEPSASEIFASLLPQVENLTLYAALLDSAASEQAARMVAMQGASDNAQKMLSELTLVYNKGRQQRITAELLDLLGGAAE